MNVTCIYIPRTQLTHVRHVTIEQLDVARGDRPSINSGGRRAEGAVAVGEAA